MDETLGMKIPSDKFKDSIRKKELDNAFTAYAQAVNESVNKEKTHDTDKEIQRRLNVLTKRMDVDKILFETSSQKFKESSGFCSNELTRGLRLEDAFENWLKEKGSLDHTKEKIEPASQNNFLKSMKEINNLQSIVDSTINMLDKISTLTAEDQSRFKPE